MSTAPRIRGFAPDLRHRVQFSQPNSVSDEYGNVSTGWVDPFPPVRAQITPRLGGETVEGARLTGRQPVVIRVRRTPDTSQVRTDWKATDTVSGAEYNIRTAVDPAYGDVDHGRWIDMLAETGVAA